MAAIRVLIVDDVSDLRSLFRTALESDDRIEVVGEAADGIEAVEKARSLRPDVITLDLAMPRLDGLRAIPELHRAAPGIRILVLSGFATVSLVERSISSCATAFCEKGVAAQELPELVARVYDTPAKVVCG